MKFIGIDPTDAPIPIRPVAHYSMGGIHTDIDGATPVPGIWSAGEAASREHARREPARLQLDGRVPGLGQNHRDEASAAYCAKEAVFAELNPARVAEEEKRVFVDLPGRSGEENLMPSGTTCGT